MRFVDNVRLEIVAKCFCDQFAVVLFVVLCLNLEFYLLLRIEFLAMFDSTPRYTNISYVFTSGNANRKILQEMRTLVITSVIFENIIRYDAV